MAIRTYALMVENEIFQLLYVDDDHKDAQLWKDSFANNAFGMDITPYANADVGWTWSENGFVPPVEEIK